MHLPSARAALPSVNPSPVRYLSVLRAQEILTLQGSPLLGAAFAIREPSVELATPLLILAVANIFLVAHVFVLNDWSDLPTDRTDPNKAAGLFTARAVGKRQIRVMATGLLAVSLLLFSLLGRAPLYLAAGIALLGALYSLPPFRWKGRPLFNSAAHLAGGALHFLLGYSLASAIDGRGLAIAAFFGVTFAAGHLTQEVRDFQGDVRNGTRTNAVLLGQRRAFMASLALFTIAHGLVLLLAIRGPLPRALAALILLYPIHLRWSLKTLSAGLTYASISRLQTRYRLLFAAMGIIMVAALWLG